MVFVAIGAIAAAGFLLAKQIARNAPFAPPINPISNMW
jgi:hypothetical protein